MGAGSFSGGLGFSGASLGGTTFGAAVSTVLSGSPLGIGASFLGLGGGGDQISRLDALFEKQVEMQAVMQEFSLRSNISKTYHDAGMEAVRNIKP